MLVFLSQQSLGRQTKISNDQGIGKFRAKRRIISEGFKKYM